MQDERPFAPGVLDGFLTKQELAAQLGLSVDALDRLCARREGPPSIKVGRRVLFAHDDVATWLAAQPKRGAVSLRGGA